MAKHKAITADDLFQDESDREWRYTGTRDELLAAGLARVGDLPGDAGAPVYSHTVNRDGRKLQFSVHSRIAQPITFWVCIRKPRPARAPEDDQPSEAEIERRKRKEALNRAIDAGEDLGIIRHDGAVGTNWTATRDDLLAAQLCEERHFPVKPKRKAYGNVDGRLGIEYWSTEAIRGGYFVHSVWWNDEGLKARGTIEKDAPPKPLEDDPERLSDRCEGFLMTIRSVIANMMASKGRAEGSVRYDEATIDKVAAALDHARQLLQSSTPVVPRAVHSDKRMTAAHGDSKFQSFIAAALTPSHARSGKRS